MFVGLEASLSRAKLAGLAVVIGQQGQEARSADGTIGTEPSVSVRSSRSVVRISLLLSHIDECRLALGFKYNSRSLSLLFESKAAVVVGAKELTHPHTWLLVNCHGSRFISSSTAFDALSLLFPFYRQ